MTKKHFKAIAAAMLFHRSSMSDVTYKLLCDHMANVCAEGAKGEFNRSKFLAACGL